MQTERRSAVFSFFSFRSESALLGNVFVTLDTEGSGDGYDASEGCLVINSTVSM